MVEETCGWAPARHKFFSLNHFTFGDILSFFNKEDHSENNQESC